MSQQNSAPKQKKETNRLSSGVLTGNSFSQEQEIWKACKEKCCDHEYIYI